MRYAILIFLLLLSNRTYAGFEEIMDATCKISLGKFAGTGTVFRDDGEYAWIIGAGHVGSPNKEGTVTFYHEGTPQEPIPVTVVWRYYANNQTTDDLAFYKFKKPAGMKITVIPLAPKTYEAKVGQVVLSYGCAHGAWPSLWRGKLLKFDPTRMWFQPTPAIGRSGSAIFNREGTHIIGVLVLSDGPDKGIAVPLSKIYEYLPNAK
jgi:hypothetical protein